MASVNPESQVFALVGGIYDAALDPALWPIVLAGVRDFMGGASAGIVAKDSRANSGAVQYDDGSIDSAWTELYFDRFVTLDPFTTGHFFSTADSPVSTADLISNDAFVETRFYREWLEPQGFVDCIGAAVEKSINSATVFNVMGRKPGGMFDGDAKRRMTALAPHVRRAVMIGSAMGQKTALADSLADTLDGLSAGVFLTAENGQITHANTSARAMLADADFLLASGGRLTARHAEANRALRGVMGAAAGGDAAIGTKGVALPFQSRTGSEYLAHVLPLTSGARRDGGRHHDATAAIFVRKAALNVTAPPEAIARRYRLTPTELRVLLAIVEIGGVPEVADVLGVAETTVKTHVARLFDKTGARRQVDLAKIVAGFATPLAH